MCPMFSRLFGACPYFILHAVYPSVAMVFCASSAVSYQSLALVADILGGSAGFADCSGWDWLVIYCTWISCV